MEVERVGPSPTRTAQCPGLQRSDKVELLRRRPGRTSSAADETRPKRVKLPHDERVAASKVLQRHSQTGSVSRADLRLLLEDPGTTGVGSVRRATVVGINREQLAARA